LFHSDLEDEPTVTENLTVATTTINDSRDDSDDKWTTFSDVSEDRSCNIVTDLLTEIDVRFKKPPRRSYAGKKRNNKSLYEDKEEEEEEHKKITKKYRKHKQKKKDDPLEEAFVQSMNEHFTNIESFSLAVE